MSAPSPLFILGAPDAEMSAIKSLLRECGREYMYALAPDRTGRLARIAPGQAATTCGTRLDESGWHGHDVPMLQAKHEVIAIEVAGPWGAPAIDHHDGSERATWGPERFLQASSLGQVIERLAIMGALPDSWAADHVSQGDGLHYHGEVGTWAVGPTDTGRIWVIPLPLVYEAAADHCPAAAIKGLCPGVDPGAFAPFLTESKRQMYFPAMSAEDFARELEISRATLLAAPPCIPLCSSGFVASGATIDPYLASQFGSLSPGDEVRDLRHLEPGTVPAAGSGECYPAEFLVGIVAALFEGIGFVCHIRRRDGRLALRSNGHGQGTLAGTRPAEVFLADPTAFGCGPTHPPGQDASYGNPVRGFFGGILIDQEL